MTTKPPRSLAVVAVALASIFTADVGVILSRSGAAADHAAYSVEAPVRPLTASATPAPSRLPTPTTEPVAPTTVVSPPPVSVDPPPPAPEPPAPTPPAVPVAPSEAAQPASPPPVAILSSEQQIRLAYEDGVPTRWRDDFDHVRFEVIEGGTSWARGDGLIMVSEQHLNGAYDHLVDVIAHEFGHLIAFTYGSDEYVGAGPEGWPAPEERPEEAWADCVQTVFTQRANPSHGLEPCTVDRTEWVGDWLAGGPPRDA